MMYFQRLRDLREDRDLTQDEISKIIGINQRTYSLYELGKRTLPTRLLIALADFYATSTDYILGRTNEITPFPKQRKPV